MTQSIKMLKAQIWQPELLPQHTWPKRTNYTKLSSDIYMTSKNTQTYTHRDICTQTINMYIKRFTDNEKSAKELMLQVCNALSITFKAKNTAKRRK